MLARTPTRPHEASASFSWPGLPIAGADVGPWPHAPLGASRPFVAMSRGLGSALIRPPPEAGLPRLHDGLGPARDPELAEEVGDVVADGLRADEQALGDLVVAETARDEAEHLALARGQVREGRGRRSRKRRLPRKPVLQQGPEAWVAAQCLEVGVVLDRLPLQVAGP